MWLTPLAFRPGLPTVAHRSAHRRSIPVTRARTTWSAWAEPGELSDGWPSRPLAAK